ncbi:MAG: tRNA threonylcarbamoyladenosine dehydratase [Candidatus Omnitrophica bacterium]|nr:tRNA threonylcarbamoyladenosine dehydratase [Candidatus Omnitrophota bacterium]
MRRPKRLVKPVAPAVVLVPEMERFARTELLLGKEKLGRLNNAQVLVVGLGAVGGHCVEALVRAGVGSLRLVDFDIIRLSNVNRHIWATEQTIGRAKAEVALERLTSINPAVKISLFNGFAAPETFEQVFTQKFAVAVDAIDSLNPKVQFLAECWRREQCVVASMGAATRTDPLKVRTADIFDTRVCPLAARMRRRLKELGMGRGVRCVYSEEVQDVHTLSQDAPPEPGDYLRGRPRRRLGSLSTLTGIFGLTLAQLAIDQIIS